MTHSVAAPDVLAFVRRGVDHQMSGDLAAAERWYRQALAIDPAQPDAHNLLGVVLTSSGRIDDGIEHLRRATRVRADVAGYWLNLGNALREAARLLDALDCYRTALRLKPGLADASYNMGLTFERMQQPGKAAEHFAASCAVAPDPDVLLALGRARVAAGQAEAGLVAFAQAADLAPGRVDILLARAGALCDADLPEQAMATLQPITGNGEANAEIAYLLGRAYEQMNDFEQAVVAYRDAIALAPGHRDALLSLGIALRRLDDDASAEQAYRDALRIDPAFDLAYYNLGNLLRDDKARLEEALACFRQAVALNSAHAPSHNNLGLVLTRLEQHSAAQASFRRALDLDPNRPEVWLNCGYALARMHQDEHALGYFEQAIHLKPDYAQAFCGLGSSLQALYRYREAANRFHQSLALDPGQADAAINLANVTMNLGDCEGALEQYRDIVARHPDEVLAARNLAFMQNYWEHIELVQILDAHRRYGAVLTESSPQFEAPWRCAGPEARRLRIGYISPDFRRHSVSWFALPVLQAHDRSQVEVIGYHAWWQSDDLTARVREVCDHWVEVAEFTDRRLVEQIRSDEIDILVDLAGLTDGNRLSVLAARSAPVQMTWIGYLTTTGVDAIDYRITDHLVDPAGYEAWQVERPLRLPGCYLCYHPAPDTPDVAPVPEGPITFASFNNLAKISPAVVDAWAAVLQAVPGSRMVIKAFQLAHDADVRARLVERFAANGIDAARLDMSGWTDSTRSHLERYHAIHVALDTWPYNGVTTTCEALWMGVPVLSLFGPLQQSRQGLSILSTIGRAEWAAGSVEELAATAADLVSDLARLSAIRAGLRQGMAASPLCDGPRFARKLEQAYRDAWTMHCRGTASFG